MTYARARVALSALLVALNGVALARPAMPARAAMSEPTEAAALRQLEDQELAYLRHRAASSLRPAGAALTRSAYVQRTPGQTTVAVLFLTYAPRGLPPACTGYDLFVATYQPHLTPAPGVPHAGHWTVAADYPGAACLSPSTPLYVSPVSTASGGAAHYRVDALYAIAAPNVKYLRFVYGPKLHTRLAALPHHFYFALTSCRDLRAVQAVDQPRHTLYERTLSPQEMIACRT